MLSNLSDVDNGKTVIGLIFGGFGTPYVATFSGLLESIFRPATE